MKSYLLQLAVVVTAGWGIGIVASPTPRPIVNFATLPQKQIAAAPSLAIDASPFQAMKQAAALPPIAPTVPEFKSFGQIHVNGQAAQEVGWGGASPPLIISGFSCCRSRMWRTTGVMPVIEVHRDLLQNGVEFTNPAYPPIIVSWWAVLLDAQWRPAQMNGTDYNVSGGGFTISP